MRIALAMSSAIAAPSTSDPVAVNEFALVSWGQWTGRIPVDGRARWLRRFYDDPERTLGGLLLTPPTMRKTRPCPLWRDAGKLAAFGEGGRSPSFEQRNAADDARTAVVRVLEALDIDVHDSAVESAIKRELAAAFESQAEARRTYQRARRARARIAENTDQRERDELAHKLRDQLCDGIAQLVRERAEAGAVSRSEAPT